MSKRIVLLLAALTLAVQPACASKYKELKGEIDSYAPSPLYQGLAGGAAANVAAPAPYAAVDDFAVASERLRIWPRSGSRRSVAPKSGPRSWCPRTTPCATLAGAAEDPDVAGKALGDGFSLQTLETLTLLRNPMIRTKEARDARGCRGLRAGGADRCGAAPLRIPHRDLDGRRRDGRPAGFPLSRGSRAQGADRRRRGARGPRTARGGAARRGYRGAHERTGS